MIYKLELRAVKNGERDDDGRLLILFSDILLEYIAANQVIEDFTLNKDNVTLTCDALQQTVHLSNQ